MYGGSVFVRIFVFIFVVSLMAAIYNGKTKIALALVVIMGLMIITMIIYPSLILWLKFYGII